jgi:hypothetical protein
MNGKKRKNGSSYPKESKKANQNTAKKYIDANIDRFTEMVKHNGLSSELLSNDFKQFPG